MEITESGKKCSRVDFILVTTMLINYLLAGYDYRG